MLRDKDTSRYRRFLRWWHHHNLLTHIFLREQDLDSISQQLTTNEDENLLLFNDLSINNDDERVLVTAPNKKIIFTENFSWAFKLTTFKLWPSLFLGLTIKDAINFALYPNLRYGSTLGDIFAGKATNQLVWSNHLGASYLKASTPVWVWPLVLASAPILSTLIISTASSILRTELARAEYDVVWNDNKFSQTKDISLLIASPLDKIINIANEGGLKGFLALFTLARIAYRLKEYDARRERAFNVLKDYFTSKVKDNLFGEIPNPPKMDSKFKRLIKTYLLWTLAEHKNKSANLFWIPSLLTTLFNLYAAGRYVEADVFTSIHAANFYRDRQACENQNNQFAFMAQSENYECTVCGEWPFISYRAAFNAQSCLDSLLVQKYLPQVLAQYIQQFNLPRNFTRIDFSQQPWSTWPDDAFNLVLTKLQQYLPSQIEVINFAQINVKNPLPSVEHTKRIIQFLNAVPAKTIDLSHSGLNIATIMNGLQDNAVTETIILSGNNVAGSVAQAVAGAIPKFARLSKLKLASCGMTGADLNKLNQPLRNNSTITELDLSNNAFDENGLTDFFTVLPQTKIKTLDVSGNKITQTVAQKISEVIPQSLLTSLKVSECLLNNDVLITLAPGATQLQTFIASNNKFDGFGMSSFLGQAHNSKLRHLDFSNNQLDESAESIANALRESLIEQINLSNTFLSIDGFKKIAAVLPHTNVKVLIANNINLGNAAGAAIAEMYRNQTAVLLAQLSLRNTGLTSQGAIPIFSSPSNLTVIDLGQNLIDGEIATYLASVLQNNHQLTVVNLDHNQLNGMVIEAVAAVLPQASLRKINFNHNPKIGANAVIKFAQGLITTIPNPDKLEQDEISRDEAHALLQAKPNTQLEEIGFADTGLDDNSERTLCRINAVADAEIDTSDNSGAAINLHTCKTTNLVKASMRDYRRLTQFFSSTTVAEEQQQSSSLLNTYLPEANTYSLRSVSALPTSSQQNTNAVMGIAVWPTLLLAIGIIGAVILVCYVVHTSTKIYRRYSSAQEQSTIEHEVEQQAQLRI